MPRPISADVSYWVWGPGDAASDRPVVIVGYEFDTASRSFVGCRRVATLGQGEAMDSAERGRSILVYERPRRERETHGRRFVTPNSTSASTPLEWWSVTRPAANATGHVGQRLVEP